MRSYYYDERVALRTAIASGERLLARKQFNSTADRENKKTEVENAEEQLRTLNVKERIEANAIWNAFSGLWPQAQPLP